MMVPEYAVMDKDMDKMHIGETRLRRVWYHYNKPASNKQGRSVLTVHWRGKCLLVHHIICGIPTETHHQKAQPRCVVRGWAESVKLVTEDDLVTAYIIPPPLASDLWLNETTKGKHEEIHD